MIASLKEKIRILTEEKEKILEAMNNVESAKSGIISLNADVSFRYIASEGNMSSYWNVPGSTSQMYIVNNLNNLAKDFQSGVAVLSAASELSAKANERIAEIDNEIASLQSEIAALEEKARKEQEKN